MFITALWVLEQEMKVARSFGYDDPSPGVLTDREIIAGSMFGGLALAQTGVIGLTPYHQISRASSALDWTAGEVSGRRTLHKMHPNLLRFARKSVGRKLLVRAGARFVPGLGWALLVVDAWAVGKWIGEQTNPFD